jgi:preprotein translocase subunit SecB
MNTENKLKMHPIQIVDIKVLTLSIDVDPTLEQRKLPDSGSFRLYHGHSEFNNETSQIGVKVGASISMDEDESPFDLTVELIGIFDVNQSEFNVEYINDWSSKNAPLILYPYLREHVHALTYKAGFDGVLLPLFIVPTFKLQK